jgi:AcrR family transcriptional regulator
MAELEARAQSAETKPEARRPRDREQAQLDILDAATVEFAEHGLSGARVDAIAVRTGMAVRMIYYYFGNKEGLYRAVLERAYGAMRRAERELGLDALSPAEAVRRLVEFVFDYQEAHPEFTRLVSIENIHGAQHIAQLETIATLNATVIDTLRTVLERGQKEGLFREDADPKRLHMLMTAFPFFRVANRHTLRALFGADPLDPADRAQQREMIVDAVLGYLQPPVAAPKPPRRR